MKFTRLSGLVPSILFFGLILAGAVSCNKEEPTIAEIKVLLPNGNPVGGADVRLFGEGTIDVVNVNQGGLLIDQTKRTGANGLATFDFSEFYKPGQTGFAILSVEIVRDFPDSVATAEGIINVIEQQTNFKEFILR